MISIIIPVFNEEDGIADLVKNLEVNSVNLSKEIIVIDAGSNDKTVIEAERAGAQVLVCLKKNRAAQMNYGASVAKGEVLYFLHADSIPPESFVRDILSATEKNYSSGCYRLRFDIDHWFLKLNCWFTRFNIDYVRFGDQSLFVTRQVLQKCGGFDEKLIVMEDQEIIHRLKKYGKFKVMNGAVTTSARKYLDNGIYRMQAIFFRIWALYYLGYSQDRLLYLYRKLISKSKL
ncbi:MAG: TIGR04283 family arsenosugar biosynthesis glycosyltransferase [Ginsengibacter sp.]